MKKQLPGICIFFLFVVNASSQQTITYFFASKKCRDSVTQKLILQIDETVALALNESTYKKWPGAFWAMELMLYQPAGYAQKIPGQIQQSSETSSDFPRSFLEMLYTLYPKQFLKHPICDFL